ncbi:hypothetical protein [Proteiniphilum sp.]
MTLTDEEMRSLRSNFFDLKEQRTR